MLTENTAKRLDEHPGHITSLNDRQSVATVALAPLSHVNEGPAILAMEDRTARGLAVVTIPPSRRSPWRPACPLS
jgi:hypothetical protein